MQSACSAYNFHCETTPSSTIMIRMKKLFIFRHGETDWNKERRFQGRTDIPLNQTGFAQATALQSFFADKKIDHSFSSTLTRARQTAETALQHNEIIQIPELVEVDLGTAEGKTETELQSIFTQQELDSWRKLHPETLHYGFPHGETRHQCIQRVQNALLEICLTHDFFQIAICCHGAIMRRFFHSIIERELQLKNQNQQPYCPSFDELPLVPNCKAYEIHFNPANQLFYFIQGPID